MTDDDTPVITVTGYAGGQQVRWFSTVAAAAYPASALLTADARGVLVIGYLTDLPASWVTAATQAHERLKAEPGRDMTGLATHRPSGPSNGPLVPVQEG